MGTATWVISDTHFGHLGVCQFFGKDGVTKLRPWTSTEEMDEAMVYNWNRVVSPKDRVYHVGDVVINRKALTTLSRLNGRKVLIKGNHDIFNLTDYTPYFEDIRAYHKVGNVSISHIPIHPSGFGNRFVGQIHGHLHDRRVLLEDGKVDERYQCVCVEQTNYTPVLLDTVIARFKN